MFNRNKIATIRHRTSRFATITARRLNPTSGAWAGEQPDPTEVISVLLAAGALVVRLRIRSSCSRNTTGPNGLHEAFNTYRDYRNLSEQVMSEIAKGVAVISLVTARRRDRRTEGSSGRGSPESD